MGSGKSEVGSIIKRLQPEWEIKMFAGKLKQICGILAGVSPAKFEDQEFKKQMSPFGMTYRELLQRVGTEGMRNNVDSDVWVRALFAEFKPCSEVITSYDRASKWIISDVRFPNEADAIKERGGYMIKVVRTEWVSCKDERSGYTYHTIKYDPFEREHPSETAMDNYDGIDCYLDNNGTLQDLEDKVKVILNQINNDKQNSNKPI